MHILAPETDNCSSWIRGRERMTAENTSWLISMKECYQTHILLITSQKHIQLSHWGQRLNTWQSETKDPRNSFIKNLKDYSWQTVLISKLCLWFEILVQSTILMSCQASQLPCSLLLGHLSPLYTVLFAHIFASNWQLTFLNQQSLTWQKEFYGPVKSAQIM